MSRKSPTPKVREPITITLHGKEYAGYYEVDREMVTVSYGDISKATQLGGLRGKPLLLARILLRELVESEQRGA